jgi:3-isopropylmalate/(R)-2-methylmalate dehydratase small subunit
VKPQPYANFSGIAAPLLLNNVNTDAVIPAPYLRSQTADLARGLFGRWRYDDEGAERSDFVLNRPPYRNASILLAGENFGCGSSREAAAWALLRFGIRCVAAPSFADIFYENAFRNGLLPAIVEPGALERAIRIASENPGAVFAVDLPSQTLSGPEGFEAALAVPEFRRDALIRGDDEIALTLRLEDEIARFVEIDRQARPWIHSMRSGA